MPSLEFSATAIQNLIEAVHDRLCGRREGKVVDDRLGLHLYNQNPRAINTFRRCYAGSHRRSRRRRDSTEAGILLRKERPELPHGQAPQPTNWMALIRTIAPSSIACWNSPASKPAKRPRSATRAAIASTSWSMASSPPWSG